MSIELINTSHYRSTNMKAYWRLESDGADSSASGYNLTGINTPIHASGIFGNGVDLERGSNQAYYVPDASCANLEISGAKTYVCWAKFESHTNDMYLVAKSNAAASVATGIRYSTANGIGFISTGLTTNNEVNSSTDPVDGAWNMIAGVFTGAALQIYVNGTLTSVSSGGSSTDTNGDFALGRLGSYNGYYFDGVLDDVAVFNAALTEAQLDAIYESTAGSKVISFV